ncbi:MAG: hypothetical protein GY947_23470 [Rhodobacteraceae bacterium]|nr:hypothetical protein [Paracoccaceae bacterium]
MIRSRFLYLIVAGLLCMTLARADTVVQPCSCQNEGEKDGFRALTIITVDENWQEKWDTPPDVIPRFKTSSKLGVGDAATLLVFFANAHTENGIAKITCDLLLSKPDGTELNRGPEICGEGKMEGRPENLRLTGLQVRFEIDEDDPVGVWNFEIGVRDEVRGSRVPLTISVEIVGNDT